MMKGRTGEPNTDEVRRKLLGLDEE
jgi:hypothetical protein